MGLTLLGIAGLLIAWEVHLWSIQRDMTPERPCEWAERIEPE